MQTDFTKQIQRNFIPGDKWIYYKLYCGHKTADCLLTSVIKAVTEKFCTEKLIDKWFFIRYGDPHNHLRIRFHVNDISCISTILCHLNESLQDFIRNKLVWKIQMDTYKRELERYGGKTIEMSETIFYYDSDLVVKTLDMLDGYEGEVIRWKFCLRIIDTLLSDFLFSTEQKLSLLDDLQAGFSSEFKMNKDLKIQIDKKFRSERPGIENILNRDLDPESELLPLFVYLEEKSKKIQNIINQILTIYQHKKSEVPLDSFLSSHIHMTCNRMFSSKQRLHELVLYNFLYRYYKSEHARLKYQK